MGDIGNKAIFSKNLKEYMIVSGKDRKDICKDLNLKYSTFADWINGSKYPRIDKVELLANYFGILKSDLIEEKTATNEDDGISIEKQKFINLIKIMDDSQLDMLGHMISFVLSSKD